MSCLKSFHLVVGLKYFTIISQNILTVKSVIQFELIFVWSVTLDWGSFFFFFFSFLAASVANGCSWARNWIWAAVTTYTTAAAMLNPLPTVVGQGLNWCCHRDATSLIHCATAETPKVHFFFLNGYPIFQHHFLKRVPLLIELLCVLSKSFGYILTQV